MLGRADTTVVSLTCGNCPYFQDLHHLRGRRRAPAGDHRLRRQTPSSLWLPVLPKHLIEDEPLQREPGLLRRIKSVRACGPGFVLTPSPRPARRETIIISGDPEMPGQRHKAGRTVSAILQFPSSEHSSRVGAAIARLLEPNDAEARTRRLRRRNPLLPLDSDPLPPADRPVEAAVLPPVSADRASGGAGHDIL